MTARRRRSTALATLLLAVVAVIWVLGGLLSMLVSGRPVYALDVVYVLSFLAFPVVGWLISVKLPQNLLGWIYLTFPAVAGAGTALEELAQIQAHSGSDATAATLMLGGGWLYGFSITLILGPGVLLFPDGRLPGRRWRFVLWGIVALQLLYGVLELFGASTVCIEPVWEGGALIDCLTRVDNPLLLPFFGRLSATRSSVVEPLLALAVGLSVISLLVRYKRSAGDVRQQIKWIIFVAAAGIVPLLLVSFARQVLGVTILDGLDTILLIFITIGLPVAIGVAILKYRLYDIDRLISRTASYAIVAGALSAVFVGSVALTQQLLPVEGQFGIVVSTLVVAALFNPLRVRVQKVVDQRFNRSKFDAQRVLDEFAIQLRDDVDLEHMHATLLSAVQETMQPSYASLWIRDRASDSE
jgi:hypothetical protein